MKKYLITLALAFLCAAGHSQSVPGYLGKRLLIGYSGHFFPSFANPNSAEIQFAEDADDVPHVGFSINYQHHLVVEYVLKKNTSIIADLGYSRTNIDIFNGNYYVDSIDYYEFDEYPSLSSTSLAIGIRKYSDHFAPLGAYYDFKLGYALLNVGDFEYEKYGRPQVISGGTTGGLTFSTSTGVRRIIADKWQIDMGIELSFFSKGWNHMKTLFIQNPENRLRFDRYGPQGERIRKNVLLKSGESRYLLQSMINFRLGVGIVM